ncbi:MAG: ATP-binding protein [Synergistaceae bacterium]|nr:ATP-binding protein [Synergistaceae bacterium]
MKKSKAVTALTDRSIKEKLVLCFSLIVFLNICFGLYEIRSLSMINQRARSASLWTESIVELNDIETKMSAARRYDLNYIMAYDSGLRQIFFERRRQYLRDIEDGLKRYRDETRVIYNYRGNRREEIDKAAAVVAQWERYVSMSDKVIGTVNAGRGEDAVLFALNESMRVYEDLVSLMGDLIALSKKGSETEALESAKTYSYTRKVIVAALIVINCFSVAVTILMTKNVKRSVDELLRVTRAVEKGDLDVEAEIFSNDELGILARQQNLTISKIKSLISEIKTQEKRAEQASHAKSQFLASMSHEIRTPMNAILGMSDLMRTDNLDGVQQDYFSNIRKMGKALLQIINDILDISKIEAGKLDLIPAHFNFFALFDDLCSINHYLAAGKSLCFETIRDDDVPEALFGDENRVRQVLTNIIGNAIKYTDAGHVNFRVKRAKAGGEGGILFVVSDTGRGIKEEDIPKLFDVFEQLEQQKNRSIMGTGLGLSITRKLVDMMRGEITVKSEYGKGSEFSVFLPLPEGDLSGIKRENFPVVMADDGVQALVVDDNGINLTVAKGFLALHNIDADVAASGMEALEMAGVKNYDLVFMDHMMPGMNGIEAAGRMRAMGGWYETSPIVALSANAISSAVGMYFEAGMNDFLAKPIEAEKLNAVLAKWLPPEKIKTAPLTDVPEPREHDKLLEALALLPGLNVEKGLQYSAGRRDAYARILRRTCEEIPGCVKDVRSFMASGDWGEYAIRVHALKSVFASIGASDISKMAYELETASKSGDYDACLAGTDPACDSMLALREDILRVLRVVPTEASEKPVEKTLVTADFLKQKLDELKHLCLEGRVNEAVAVADELKQVSAEGADCSRQVEEIARTLESYDYEAAVNLIDEFMSGSEKFQEGGLLCLL